MSHNFALGLGTRVQIHEEHWDSRLAGRTGCIAAFPAGIGPKADTCWVELDCVDLKPGDVDGAEIERSALKPIP